MKCKLCEDRLLEYLYGELGAEDAAAMEQHLKASDTCRREYEGLASVLDVVAEAEEEGLSPAVHTRIMGHAEEAHVERRSLWAWMFRPAVTTVVIGAIAAGVYFTTLRHKPPSYIDERVLSEKSLLGKSKQRSAPSFSGTKVDSPQKEAKDQAFRERPAESPGAMEKEEAAPERLKTSEKPSLQMLKQPSRPEETFMATGAMDEETGFAPARKKAGALPTEEDRALVEGVERAPSHAYGTRALHMALPTSSRPDLAVEKTRVPSPIVRALDLASEGSCPEAADQVDAYATKHPGEETCGDAWLEVARCYAKKGDTEAARKTADKALAIPAHESEARAFLKSLPPPTE